MSNSLAILAILAIITFFIITKIYDFRDMSIGALLLSLLFDNPKKDYSPATDFSSTLKNMKNLLEPEAKTDYIDYSNISFIKDDFTYDIDIDDIAEQTVINLKMKFPKNIFYYSRITSRVTNRTKIHFNNIPLPSQKSFKTGDPKFDHNFKCLSEKQSEVIFFLDLDTRKKLLQCFSKSGGISFFENTILIKNKYSSTTNYNNLKDTVSIIKKIYSQYLERLSNEKISLFNNLKKEKIPTLIKYNLEILNNQYGNDSDSIDYIKNIFNNNNLEIKTIAALFLNSNYTEDLIKHVNLQNNNYDENILDDILKLALEKKIQPPLIFLKNVYHNSTNIGLQRSILQHMKNTDNYAAFLNETIYQSSHAILNDMINDLKLYGNAESITILNNMLKNNKLSYDQKIAIKKTIKLIKKAGDSPLEGAISITESNQLDGALSTANNLKGSLSEKK